jgi:NTE family protein
MKLGIALSGGGFRATVFHLGVLDRLAAGDLLKSVRFISTVSGGSLCVGLVYLASGYQWPTSNQYRSDVLQHARGLLTGTDLQGSFVRRVSSGAGRMTFHYSCGVSGGYRPDSKMYPINLAG